MAMDIAAGADQCKQQQDGPQASTSSQSQDQNQVDNGMNLEDPSEELNSQLEALLSAFNIDASSSQAQEAEFLTKALTLFLPQRPLHWWCHPTLQRISLEMLHLFAIAENDAVQKFKATMEEVISSCLDCAMNYYTGRRAYCQRSLRKYDEESVKLFLQMLMAWDMNRLQHSLERFSTIPSHELTPTLKEKRTIAICELLVDPSLLLDPQHSHTISQLLVTVLGQVLAVKGQKIHAVLPGLFFLALHKDNLVRGWAVRSLRRSASTADEGPLDTPTFIGWKQFDKILSIAFDHMERLYTPSQVLLPENQAIVSSFTDQRLAVWKGVSACLYAISPIAIRADISAKPQPWGAFRSRLIDTLLDHNTKAEFMEALSCLRTMTTAVGHAFWDKEGSTTEARLQVAERHLKAIIEHPAMDFCALMQSKKIYTQVENNMEVPKRPFVESYSWIASFAKSFKNTKDQDQLLRVAAGSLLAKIGARMTVRLNPAEADKDKAMNTLLLEYDLVLFEQQWEIIRRLLTTSKRDEGSLVRWTLKPHWTWMSSLFATGHNIITTSSLPAQSITRISSLFATIQTIAKKVVPGLMALDVEDMWANFAIYSQSTVQSKSEVIVVEALEPRKPIEEPWFRLVRAMTPEAITDDNSLTDIRDWQKLLIEKFSDLVLLPRVELKESAKTNISRTNPDLAKAVQVLCDKYNGDLDALLRSNRIMLNRIRDQGDVWTTQLLSSENRSVVVQLLKLWCSTDDEVRSEALFLMRSAWKEVKRSTCLRMALELGGDESLRALTLVLNEWRQRGSPGATTAPALFAFLEEAVTVLFLTNSTDGEGGLYLQLFLELTSAQEVNHHLELIKRLWDSIWVSLASGFDAGRKWHQQEVKAVVINTMKVLFKVGLVMIGEIKAMERLLEFEKPDGGGDDVFESGQQSLLGVKKETMPLEQVLATTEPLSVWLFARDESVSSQALELTCAVLNLLADHNLTISKELYERLDSIATNTSPVPTCLTEQLREKLWICLSRHTEVPQVEDLSPVASPKLRPQDSRSRPSREDTVPQPETIVVSDDDDDFGDVNEADLEDIDFDGDMKIDQEKSQPSFSAAAPKSATVATASSSRPPPPPPIHSTPSQSPYFSTSHLPPGFMAHAKAPVQSKLSFKPVVPPQPRVSRTLPSSLTKFNLQVSKPAPKASTPVKKGNKLSQMRADHRRERVGLAEAAKLARVASRVQPKVTQATDKESQSSSSESEADSDSGPTGLEGLVEAQQRMLPKTIQHAKPASSAQAPRKTKLLELSDITSNQPATDSFALRQQKAREEKRRQQRLTPNLSALHRQILSWDVSATGDQPPNGAEYSPIPKTFASVSEYQRTFEPLLILESWQQLIAAKEEVNPETDSVAGVVSSRMSIDDFQDTHMRMSQEKANSLMAEDIVVVYDPSITNVFTSTGNAARAKPFLAKVQSITKDKGESVVVLRTLTTTHREYAALAAMRHYELCADILQPPVRESFKPSNQLVQKFMDTYHVNTPQAHAIIGAIERKEGFTLIQGPPGTGKTKTILGLVGALLREDRNSMAAPVVRTARFSEQNLQSGDVGRLLVCAPSNAAIDEIVKRLITGIRDTSGNMFIPKVVRVGSLETINSQVREVALESLIAKELESKTDSKDDFQSYSQKLSELRAKQAQLHQELEKARLELVHAKEGSDMMLVSELQSKIKNLNKAKWKNGQDMDSTRVKQSEASQKKDKDRKEARDKILGQADVICSTLSASGHDLLTNAGFTFETVIIDEAAQAVEISSLIPLKYNCKRCIMVGDPNQLPPTVISQLATKYDYNQSLFVRIQNNSPSSVYLLSIQYRMHPDISLFPSREFYKSLLKDGPSMAQKTQAEWHRDSLLCPYRFFDVHDGREKVGLSHSQHNPREAEVAVELIRYLCNTNGSINFFRRIGVISPYKQQVRSLKEIFSRFFGREILEAIDFNTVDGFQGQEKDLIIFSCVRASSAGSVGFLADIRRMNVALTRARQSLFILGHADTLRREPIWGDLVADAEERQLFTRVENNLFAAGRGYGAPKNIFKPIGGAPHNSTSKSLSAERRNELYGRAKESENAVAIDLPKLTIDDLMEIDEYPSLPSVEQPPPTPIATSQVGTKNRVEPRPQETPPQPPATAAKSTDVTTAGSATSPIKPGVINLEAYRRQQQERAVATTSSVGSGTNATPLAGSKRHFDGGNSSNADNNNNRNDPASSSMRPNPSSSSNPVDPRTSYGGHALPKRPKASGGSSLFIKSKPMQSMKNSAPQANASELRERLAAGVIPIRKSYPSGSQQPRPQPRKTSANFNLDDILGQIKKS
ncbi:DEAD-box type RNA helicase [Actinomortierella wolfii]|nr:DEAD-box type RNA helicase [Actinomortierella wolfii]